MSADPEPKNSVGRFGVLLRHPLQGRFGGSATSENQEKRVIEPARLVKREVADLLAQGAHVDRADHLA
jgi:hypothetical protein